MGTLVDKVLAILESISDKRTAAEVVASFMEVAVRADLLAQQQQAGERAKDERRETERARKAEYRERLRLVPGTDGDSAGHVGTKRDTTPPLASPPLSGSSLSLRADPDPERAIPGLMPFPVVGATDKWEATQELLDEHQAAFPSIDVLAEYRKARAYLISNPTNRKTGKGMPRTLFSWLARGQERGTAVKRQAAPQNAASAKPSALAVYCDWHKDARNDKRPNQFKPKDDCPSCKHLRAAARPREDNSQLALGGRS